MSIFWPIIGQRTYYQCIKTNELGLGITCLAQKEDLSILSNNNPGQRHCQDLGIRLQIAVFVNFYAVGRIDRCSEFAKDLSKTANVFFFSLTTYMLLVVSLL